MLKYLDQVVERKPVSVHRRYYLPLTQPLIILLLRVLGPMLLKLDIFLSGDLQTAILKERILEELLLINK